MALLLPLLAPMTARAQGSASMAALRARFRSPPPEARPMMRWWWFGPAATRPEITRELEQMKAAGIGGVEVANLYPLRLDDPATGFHNQPYLSDEHIAMLRFAADEARRLGLRMDVTLGSGWPFGGPHIPVTENAGVLRTELDPVDASGSAALPSLAAGETLLSAFALATADGSGPLSEAQSLNLPPADPRQLRLQLPAGPAPARSVLFFIASRTGMVVKRPSVGAGGFVLDHYDPEAVRNHLHAVGDRLLEAFPTQPPFAVFSDSLEVAGTNWTGSLLEQFRKRRGYDLLPHLPALVGDAGPDTAAIRHDWGKTLTELVVENYLEPARQWAHAHGTRLRSQNYGTPPVTLDSYRHVDLIEGEGGASPLMWRQFSRTRWAASAAHLLDQPIVSSETWTWLHSPAFRAAPLDMKSEADLHFLQGINQLIGHGWPYSGPEEPEPGNRMYAAAAFNAHNPWFFAMPEVMTYLQRVSFALRQGKPAADVAIYMPDDDAWASFSAVRGLPATANAPTGTRAPGLVAQPATAPGAEKGAGAATAGSAERRAAAVPKPVATAGNVDEDASLEAIVGKELIGDVLDAGFSVDFIDPAMIDREGLHHRVLVLPHVDRIPLATYRRIEAFAKAGGVVFALGATPSQAPGLREQASDTPEIAALSNRLFQAPGHAGHLAASEAELATALARYAEPEVRFAVTQSVIGFHHRVLPDGGDLYFIANTGNEPARLDATFAHKAKHAEWWDPLSGEVSPVRDTGRIRETLEPYGSRLLLFSDDVAAPHTDPPLRRAAAMHLDLSNDWSVRLGDAAPKPMQALHSWAEEPSSRFFSGSAVYEKTFPLTAAQLHGPLWLDFGPTQPEPVDAGAGKIIRTRAYLQAPVRDAAEVFVNGQRVGVVWHPPYRLEIREALRPGTNTLRIRVGNTAVNELAGQNLPDYRLLRAFFGNEFQPQDMNGLEPLPSGLLGPVSLQSP